MSRFRPTDLRGAVVLFVPLLLAGFVASLLAYGADLNPISFLLGRRAEVEIPDVVGQTQPRAVLELTGAGVSPKVEFVISLSVPRGVVAGLEPAAGTTVRMGDTVVVRVSRGNARVSIPDPGDREAEPFLANLESTGLVVERSTAESETVPKDRIIKLDPPAGSVVDGGTKVKAVVSLGPAKRPVPDVAGRSLNGASFLLGDAGLSLGGLIERDDPKVPVGAIMGAEPGVGTVVDRDTPVKLVVSLGPPPVAVPNVVGRTAVQARKSLDDVGIVAVETTKEVAPNDRSRGTVVEMVPAPDANGQLNLRPGTVVTLTVARVPAPTSTITPSTVPTRPVTTAPARSTTTAQRPRPTTATTTTTRPAPRSGGG